MDGKNSFSSPSSGSASLGSEKIPLLLLRFSVPTVLSLLAASSSSLCDALFLARLSRESAGVVGTVFPLYAVIQTLGYTFGLGGGSLVARSLGEQNPRRASEVTAASVLWSGMLTLLFLVSGICFLDPILALLGTSPELLPLTRRYASLLLISALPTVFCLVGSLLLRSGGFLLPSMLGLILPALLNIAGDALLVGRLGVIGAALSSLLSELAGAGALLPFFLGKKADMRLRFSKQAFRPLLLGKVFSAGSPSLLRQGLAVPATALTNSAASPFGTSAVAALGITNRIFLFLYAFGLGIAQGMMPIVAFRYGRGDGKAAKKAFLWAILFSTGILLAVSLPVLIFPRFFLSLFRKDESLFALGVPAVRWECAVLFLQGILGCSILACQAVGKSPVANLLSGARQGFFFIPLILLLPRAFGEAGLSLVPAISDLCAAALAVLFFWKIRQWVAEVPQSEKSTDATGGVP